MVRLIISFILVITFAFSETGNQMKSPSTGAFDFTYENNLSNSIQNFKPEKTLDKVLIQIGKQNVTTRREKNIFSCLNDAYGSVYCPAALAPANKYSTFKESTIIEETSTVIDYEKGNWQEKTSYVRDFVNGISSPHVNTEINYSNGTSASYSTGVIDYTNKINSLNENSYTPALAKPLNVGSNTVSINFNHRGGGNTGHNLNAYTCGSVIMMNGSCIDIQGNYGSRAGWSWNSNVNMYNVTIPGTVEGTPLLKYNNNLEGGINKGTCGIFSRDVIEPLYNSLISNNWIIKTSSVIDGSPISSPEIINGMCKINVKAYQATYATNNNYYVLKGYSGTGIPYTSLGNKQVPNINLYTSGGKFFINGQAIKTPDAAGFYGSIFVNIQFEYVGKLAYQACPSTYLFFDGKCVSQNVGLSCPSGYQDNGTNCKKNVLYSFYSYGCPTGFSPQNKGFTTFTKTDPDITIQNDYTLDDAVNSSTPPINNCVQTLNSTAYEYLCSSGYNPITSGLTSCPAGTSGNCNNPASPEANCYKDISYKHYTYGCSDGYITDNYGLTTCSKTDPDTTKNNESTLNDDCNSPTPPDGNCRKSFSYKYYEYQCNGTNSFNEQWTPINPGTSSCTKTDTNVNTINTELGSDCNPSTAPTKNCVAAEYNCGESEGGIYLKDINEYSNGTSLKQTSSYQNFINKDGNNCPVGYIETTGTEREKGECKTEIPYSYYTYICPTDTNQYGYTYEIQNTGGNCNAVTLEQLMDTNNDGIGDSCNSSAPPTNNCIRKSYDEIAGINPPVYVDNQWQCSPFSCNSNRKCGYGVCPSGTTPSDTLFQDVAYNPLGASYNGTCIGEICDYVKNKKISYCVSKQCPVGPEYVSKDGNCYKEECPKGTYMSGSKCISSSY